MMNIIIANPPMIDVIDAKFNVRGKSVIFAWGDKIYNPMATQVPFQLEVHEKLHGARQHRIGIENWWQKYIEDDEFRLEEEVLAHYAEFQAQLVKRGSNRKNRRYFLSLTAQRLANPIYQYHISTKRAHALLVERGKVCDAVGPGVV